MGLFGAIWRKVNWKHVFKQCTKELSNHKHLDYFNMLIIPHLGSLYKVTLDMKRPGKFNESLPKLLTVLGLIIWPVGTCVKLNIYIYIYIYIYTHIHTHSHTYVHTYFLELLFTLFAMYKTWRPVTKICLWGYRNSLGKAVV